MTVPNSYTMTDTTPESLISDETSGRQVAGDTILPGAEGAVPVFTTSEHMQSASNVMIHQTLHLHVPQGGVDTRHAVPSSSVGNAFWTPRTLFHT